MTFLPVVARELSVMARRKSTYWSRAVTGAVALIVMLWLLLVSRAHVSYADMGSSIFMVLSSICFAFATLAGVQATSDSVSEEKREGTLGLLFLTDLKGIDVVGGKLAATSAGTVLALMGVIPMLSLALLLGGVTLTQFGLMAVVLGNTLFFSLSLGVLVSTLSENERRAMMGTFVGLLLIVLGPFLAAYLLRSRFGFFEELMAISPLYAFTALHAKPGIAALAPQFFWHSIIITHFLAWVFLLSAAWILPRFVNALPAARLDPIRHFVQNFVYGRIEQRKRHRAELLDRNAFLWLASRERVKPKYAWVVIFCFAGLYFWIGAQFTNMMLDVVVIGSLMFLVHLVFKIWAASEVCNRLIQDRRSGAFELLLSTPLSVKEIADGQTKALARLFLNPVAFLFLLEFWVFWWGSQWVTDWAGRSDKKFLWVVGVSTFLLDIWALKWVGLWLSLTGKSMERVLLSTLMRILGVPWLIFAAFVGLIGSLMVFQQRTPAENEMTTIWWVISIIVSLWFGSTARRKFLSQFRELASRRFETVLEPEPLPTQQATNIKSKVSYRLPPFYRRHPVTASVLTVLTMLFLAGWVRGIFWEYRAEKEFSRIRAEGFPITEQELIRYAPAVAAGDNAFAVLVNAGAVNTGRRWFPSRKSQTHVSSGELEQYKLLLAGNQVPLRAMWQLPKYSRGSLDVTGLSAWMEQTRQSGFMALVEGDLLVALHSDTPEPHRITNDVFALVAHARLLRDQPLTFAQQNASDALHRLSGALGFAFERDVLDEPALLRLQSEIEKMERTTNVLTRAIAVQRAQMFEMSRNPNSFARMGMAMPRPISLLETFSAAVGSRDKELMELSQHFRHGMMLADMPIPERLNAAMSVEYIAPRVNRLGVTMFTGDLPQLFLSDASFIASRNLILAGIAAERYSRKYGKLPENLDAMVPEFLSAIPDDPFTGEPLRSVFTDRLLIYSVGADGHDNTATISSDTNKGADLRLPLK